MKLLSIFFLGVGILVGAIALNALAGQFGFVTWYVFVQNPSSAAVADYFWLFGAYPFGLGLCAYITNRVLRK